MRGAGADNNAKRANEGEKEVIFKNYGSFSKIVGHLVNT